MSTTLRFVDKNSPKLKYKPFMLIVDQTVRCNEACFFCWRADPKEVKRKTAMANKVVDMPFEVLQEIVDQASQYSSIRTFNVCGPMGDPTVITDIAERGMYARSKGFMDRMMNTNGVALDRHDPHQMLVAFNNMKVSLDTLDEDKYVEIHGKPHLDRVLKNIEMMWKVKQDRNIGGQFKAKITMNEKNEDEREDFIAWSEKTGVPIEWKSVHSFIDHMPQYSWDAGMKLCEQPYKTINFNFKGELTTCCINWHLEPTFGTLEQGTLQELWEGEEYEEWRRHRMEGLCDGCTGLGGRAKRNAESYLEQYEKLGEEEFNVHY